MTKLRLFLAFSVLLVADTNAENLLFDVMQANIDRSMAELESASNAIAPYFISHTAHQNTRYTSTARNGGITIRSRSSERPLDTVVRVGSAEFDNTNYLAPPTGRGQSSITGFLSIDDDAEYLQREFWLNTDQAYKAAVQEYNDKSAALASHSEPYEMPDFTTEDPAEYIAKGSVQPIDEDAVDEYVKSLSSVFGEYPEIHDSTVAAEIVSHSDTYLNSEGSRFFRIDDYAIVSVNATAFADGEPNQWQRLQIYRHRFDQLPPAEELAVEVRNLAEKVSALTNATSIERYSGPVLFTGKAATQLIASNLTPGFLSQRPPIRRNYNRSVSLGGEPPNPFQAKLNRRVLPRSFSVIDDASATAIDGVETYGGWPIDIDAVPGQTNTLVENGILVGLLATRQPTSVSSASTGSNFANVDGAMPSNLIVRSNDGLDKESLTSELQLLASDFGLEYGLEVTELQSLGTASRPQSPDNIGIATAYKVYPDGTRELIQQAQISRFVITNFRDIVATSNTVEVHTWFMRYRNLRSNPQKPVTVAAPSMLFEDLLVTSSSRFVPPPPKLPNPLAKN